LALRKPAPGASRRKLLRRRTLDIRRCASAAKEPRLEEGSTNDLIRYVWRDAGHASGMVRPLVAGISVFIDRKRSSDRSTPDSTLIITSSGRPCPISGEIARVFLPAREVGVEKVPGAFRAKRALRAVPAEVVRHLFEPCSIGRGRDRAIRLHATSKKGRYSRSRSALCRSDSKNKKKPIDFPWHSSINNLGTVPIFA